MNICITRAVVPPTCRPPSAEQRPRSCPEQPQFFPSRSARGPAESTCPLLSSCPLCGSGQEGCMRYIRHRAGRRQQEGAPVGANLPWVSGMAMLLSFITFWCAVCRGLAGSAPLATTNLPLSFTPATHTPSPFGGILHNKQRPAYRGCASATRVRRPPAQLTLRQADLRRTTSADRVHGPIPAAPAQKSRRLRLHGHANKLRSSRMITVVRTARISACR